MKTNRLFAFLLALVMSFTLILPALAETVGDEAPAAESTRGFSTDTIVVFYTDSNNWDGNSAIHVHYWIDGTSDTTSWPGAEMRYLYDNGFGESVYGAAIPADVNRIIFNNNGSNQTGTISSNIANGAWWHGDAVYINNESYHAAAPATCTEAGNTEYYELDGHCYNKSLAVIAEADTVIPATGHAWDLENPAWGDLESDGYFGYQTTITFTCTTCHDTTSVTASGGWVEEMDPNCAEPSYKCTTCTATFGGRDFSKEYRWDEGPIDPTAHPFSLTHTAANAATCETAGNSEYWYCGVCDKYFSDEDGEHEIAENSWVIPALGHDWGDWTETTPATCTEAGVETRTCSRDASHTETRAIEATGHAWGTPVYEWAADYSTCTATRVCANDESHVETETVNAEITVTSATCAVAGEKTYTATFTNGAFAQQTKTETIPATGNHTAGEAVQENVHNATCTEAGSYESVVYCSVCHEELSRETIAIPATGHTYGDDGVCTVCGNSAVAKVGNVFYPTLQEAVNAAHALTGEVTVTLLKDTTENVWVHQKLGLNLTITGENKPTINGQLIIDGDGNFRTDTLTIDGLKIVKDANTTLKYKDALIILPKTTGVPESQTFTNNHNNYAHHITIKNCDFDANGDMAVAAMRAQNGGGSFNDIKLYNLNIQNMHSVAQFYSSTDFTIDGLTATNVKNGINCANQHGTVTIKNATISAQGYAFRMQTGSDATAELGEGNTFSGSEGIIAKSTVVSTIKITDGRYSGPLTQANSGKYEISGGIFTVAPALAYCADGLYPIANPDENTNAEYPYTVGHPVALVNDLGYMTFAAAAAARTSNNDVITLLADIEDAYTLAVGETLKVKLDGHALTVKAPEGYLLKTEGPVDGVTTYSLKQIPPLPEAEITEVKGADAHTNIEEWAYSAENGYGPTGEYVETLGAEYKFVLDPETTREQKDYYSSWGTDFLVSFDADMDANSFGLFGAYNDYNIAFKFPEKVNANQEFKLVSWLGQTILGGNGFDIRFSDIMDISFFCGVYNLSAKNCGKTMTVKLVMWDPENPDVIEVRDTVTYTFPTPEMPGAEVTDVTGTHTNIDEYVFTEGSYDVTGTVEALDA